MPDRPDVAPPAPRGVGRDDLGLEWSVAARPHPDETAMGDGAVCQELGGGWLLAVMDGLGHGPGADHARAVTSAVITERASSDLASLVSTCHGELRATRGAALAVASLARNRTVTWTGIGNIEGLVLRRAEGRWRVARRLTPVAGVVGYHLPRVRLESFSLGESDVLVLHSDGVVGDLTTLSVHVAVGAMADATLERFARPDDDALVLMARVAEVLP